MILYIDSDFRCHVSPGEGLRAVETTFFDGKTRAYIEGYRLVPAGETWAREDGAEFTGEMVSPWTDWQTLDKIQGEYERAQYPELLAQNGELLETLAQMVEEVYEMDLKEMGGNADGAEHENTD